MKGSEDLPGEGAKDDEDGFEDQSEGESAEGAEIDFWSAVGPETGDAAGSVCNWFDRGVREVDG